MRVWGMVILAVATDGGDDAAHGRDAEADVGDDGCAPGGEEATEEVGCLRNGPLRQSFSPARLLATRYVWRHT